jgi:hypothetical protein
VGTGHTAKVYSKAKRTLGLKGGLNTNLVLGDNIE